MSAKDILELVLLTQYFDTVKDIGCGGKANTIFVSSGDAPNIRDSILQSNAASFTTGKR
jgi:hypothetical protein